MYFVIDLGLKEFIVKQHFYNCIKYIYNNPVKAGICKKPDDYPFSNYKPIDFAITENYTFIDIDEDNEKLYKDFLFKFLKENDTSLQDLKNNSKILKELIPILNNDYKLSLRKIAEELHVSREKIQLLSKNQ